jgi:hypothetical protein
MSIDKLRAIVKICTFQLHHLYSQKFLKVSRTFWINKWLKYKFICFSEIRQKVLNSEGSSGIIVKADSTRLRFNFSRQIQKVWWTLLVLERRKSSKRLFCVFMQKRFTVHKSISLCPFPLVFISSAYFSIPLMA